MKIWKLYFFSPECGGRWLETSVAAKTLKEAKEMVGNLYYVSPRKVFAK